MPQAIGRDDDFENETWPSLWLTLLTTACAGGMGWGIRGQYGHESGAMIAGVLVALTISVLFARQQGTLYAARIAALGAIGISFGGCMTYGQTVGLTHDVELVNNWSALRWGMLGLFLKGGIWIGLAGALIGMGLSGRRYRVAEIVLLTTVLIGAMFVGLWMLNEPFDIANRQLPRIYFSDTWQWEPDKLDLKPRRERWGGLLCAWLVLTSYVAGRGDRLAFRLALYGFVFGGFGFVGGQSLQAFHAWNSEAFQQWFGVDATEVPTWWARFYSCINWWNLMETVFGAIMGLGLGWGVWKNRHFLPTADADQLEHDGHGDKDELNLASDVGLTAFYFAAVMAVNFLHFGPLGEFADHALTMGVLPLALIFGGRHAPYLIALPIVAGPIAGKTLLQLSYTADGLFLQPAFGWPLLLVLPVTLLTIVSIVASRAASAQAFARIALLATAWVYFWLNFCFFHLPWPWSKMTGRTPSAVIFGVCLLVLTLLALACPSDDDI